MAENGRLPAADLAFLVYATAHRLRTDAANSWNRVNRDFLTRVGINIDLEDSYRTYDTQVQIFLERYVPQATGNGPFGDVRIWNGVRYVRVTGSAAAIPGTSNHGWGVAVDAAGLGGFNGTNYAHLAAVAPRHGWNNEAGKTIDEPWHWEYDPAADTHPTVQEDTMHIIRNGQTGSVGFGGAILVSGGVGVRILDGTQLTALQTSGIAMANLSKAQYDAAVARFGS